MSETMKMSSSHQDASSTVQRYSEKYRIQVHSIRTRERMSREDAFERRLRLEREHEERKLKMILEYEAKRDELEMKRIEHDMIKAEKKAEYEIKRAKELGIHCPRLDISTSSCNRRKSPDPRPNSTNNIKLQLLYEGSSHLEGSSGRTIDLSELGYTEVVIHRNDPSHSTLLTHREIATEDAVPNQRKGEGSRPIVKREKSPTNGHSVDEEKRRILIVNDGEKIVARSFPPGTFRSLSKERHGRRDRSRSHSSQRISSSCRSRERDHRRANSRERRERSRDTKDKSRERADRPSERKQRSRDRNLSPRRISKDRQRDDRSPRRRSSSRDRDQKRRDRDSHYRSRVRRDDKEHRDHHDRSRSKDRSRDRKDRERPRERRNVPLAPGYAPPLPGPMYTMYNQPGPMIGPMMPMRGPHPGMRGPFMGPGMPPFLPRPMRPGMYRPGPFPNPRFPPMF